jgi:hypothetical protein
MCLVLGTAQNSDVPITATVLSRTAPLLPIPLWFCQTTEFYTSYV